MVSFCPFQKQKNGNEKVCGEGCALFNFKSQSCAILVIAESLRK